VFRGTNDTFSFLIVNSFFSSPRATRTLLLPRLYALRGWPCFSPSFLAILGVASRLSPRDLAHPSQSDDLYHGP
jgi:cytochrome c biogenesis protein CcdA